MTFFLEWLHDFLLFLRGCVIFWWRVCMIFYLFLERFHDFFWRGCVIFYFFLEVTRFFSFFGEVA